MQSFIYFHFDIQISSHPTLQSQISINFFLEFLWFNQIFGVACGMLKLDTACDDILNMTTTVSSRNY